MVQLERYNLMYSRFDQSYIFHALLKILLEYKMSTVEYPNIEPGSELSGYGAASHLVAEEKVKIGMKKLAEGPEPDLGPAPETRAQARGAGVRTG